MIVCLFAVTALFGCAQVEWKPLQKLEGDVESILAPSVGASYEINITTNTAWAADVRNVDWILLSSTEAVGNSSLIVTILANTTDLPREYKLVFASKNDPSVTYNVAVSQPAKADKGYMRIKDLRTFETKGSNTTLNYDYKIKGFVNSGQLDKNWIEGNFSMQDSFSEENSGINVVYPDAVALESCSEVELSIKGATLSRSDAGLLTLTLPEGASVTTLPTSKVTLSPVDITVNDLSDVSYECMYVSLDAVQVADESLGAVFSDCPVMENEAHEKFVMMTSDEASFAGYQLPEYSGTVCGIAGEGKVWPTKEADVVLNRDRLGVVIGIEGLPYVFPLIGTNGSSNTLKYLSVNKGTFDAQTCLCTNEYVDDGPRVKLHVRMAGRTSSDVQSTPLWTHASGADNIPSKSFVNELSGGSDYTGETYFKLIVPLLSDLPQSFDLSFGLAVWKDAGHRDWAIRYSKDDNEWYDGAKLSLMVSGETKVDNKNVQMQFYTFRITPEIEVLAGETLYIKITPDGDAPIAGTAISPWNVDCRLWGAITLTPAVASSVETPVPDGAVYFEPFDHMYAGADYLIGDRLGHLSNLYGEDISQWTDERKAGLRGENVGERPGYAQIGLLAKDTHYMHSYKHKFMPGSLTTPKFRQSGKLNLTFKAMAFAMFDSTRNCDDHSGDSTEITVEVLGGGTIDGETTVTVSELPYNAFETFSLQILDATEETYLRFSSKTSEEKIFARWFIDDITITK